MSPPRRFIVKNGSRFPGCPTSIAWGILAPFDFAVAREYGHTLAKLNERGGLTPKEIFGVINKLGFREVAKLTDEQCVSWLVTLSERE